MSDKEIEKIDLLKKEKDKSINEKTYIWRSYPDDWEKLRCDSVYDVERFVNSEFFFKKNNSGIKRATAGIDCYRFEIDSVTEETLLEFVDFLYGHGIINPKFE